MEERLHTSPKQIYWSIPKILNVILTVVAAFAINFLPNQRSNHKNTRTAPKISLFTRKLLFSNSRHENQIIFGGKFVGKAPEDRRHVAANW